jgi:hypothetical protein
MFGMIKFPNDPSKSLQTQQSHGTIPGVFSEELNPGPHNRISDLPETRLQVAFSSPAQRDNRSARFHNLTCLLAGTIAKVEA